jgi:hypothetical protein
LWISMDSVGLHAGATPAVVSDGGRSEAGRGRVYQHNRRAQRTNVRQ